MNIKKHYINTLYDLDSFTDEQLRTYSQMKYGVIDSINMITESIYASIRTELTKLTNPNFLIIAKNIPSSSNYLSEGVHSKYADDNKQINTFVLRGIREKDNLKGFSTLHYMERANFSPSSIIIEDKDIRNIKSGDDIVVIDDAYVAGTFTSLVIDSLSSKGLKNLHIFYFVRIHPTLLKKRPYYEHELNSSHFLKISDLVPYINANQLRPTRKLIKLLLASNRPDLQKFYTSLNQAGLVFMKSAVKLVDTKDFDDEFRDKMSYIKKGLLR